MRPDALEWLARGLAAAACAFFVAFAVGEGIPDLLRGIDDGLVLTLVLLAVAVGGAALAWRDPRAGGALLVAAGGALGVHVLRVSGGAGVRAGLIYAVPFVLPGLLFLAIRSRRSI
jgi:hypothetical protein